MKYVSVGPAHGPAAWPRDPGPFADVGRQSGEPGVGVDAAVRHQSRVRGGRGADRTAREADAQPRWESGKPSEKRVVLGTMSTGRNRGQGELVNSLGRRPGDMRAEQNCWIGILAAAIEDPAHPFLKAHPFGSVFFNG